MVVAGKTYYFDQYLSFSGTSYNIVNDEWTDADSMFTSNNVSYKGLWANATQIFYYAVDWSSVLVYDEGGDGWVSSAYRTIHFVDNASDWYDEGNWAPFLLDNSEELTNVDVSGKTFMMKNTISAAVFDIDDVKFYSYIPDAPDGYYRKMSWDGNYLNYVSDFLDSAVTVYADDGAGWIDDRYRTILFGNNVTLTNIEYAWLLTVANEVDSDMYLVNKTDLTAVADAIRAKGGTDQPLVFPDGFIAAIQAMPIGDLSQMLNDLTDMESEVW